MKTLEKHPSNTSYADLCKSCLMTKADVFDLFLYVDSDEEKKCEIVMLEKFCKEFMWSQQVIDYFETYSFFKGINNG